jgi:hypothetical protein
MDCIHCYSVIHSRELTNHSAPLKDVPNKRGGSYVRTPTRFRPSILRLSSGCAVLCATFGRQASTIKQNGRGAVNYGHYLWRGVQRLKKGLGCNIARWRQAIWRRNEQSGTMQLVPDPQRQCGRLIPFSVLFAFISISVIMFHKTLAECRSVQGRR